MKKIFMKGFTIIEVMVVVTIITILLSIVIVSVKEQKIRARDRVRVADINTIRLAVEEYKLYCGEYPNKIELDTKNGHCPSGVDLSYFLPNIPVAPIHSDPILTGSGGKYHDSEIEGSGYLYAGLSTPDTISSLRKCYDYHIAAELEKSPSFLSKDQDNRKNSDPYSTLCSGSHTDFGASGDDSKGLYDFGSSSSNSSSR